MRAALVLSGVLGLALASPARADVRELVGAPAPELRARTLDDGAAVDLTAYRGRAVLLVFVATWCGACRRLAPELEALRREHPEEELVILAVSHEPRARVRQHVVQNTPGIPWLQCTGRTAIRYHADALPTSVVIDRAGNVTAGFQGARPETIAALREALAAAMR